MSTLTQKTNRVTEAQANLIDQFRAHVNIDALVKALAQQSQELENASFEVLFNTLIPTAIGEQLDGLGEIVGVERGGLIDSDYRVRIGAQILLNVSSGTTPELIELAVALGAPGVVVTEVYPAKIELEAPAPLINGEEIGSVLDTAVSAGVGFTFIWFEAALGTEFRFGTAGQGFDEGLLGDMI